MSHILFVCTGNIFRSMIAEYALRYTAGPTADYSFSSAGTEAKVQPMVEIVRQGLNARGIDPSGHVQRRLTPELFNGANLVVAMGLDHVAFIEEMYKKTPVLFDEVAYGRRQAILDTWEAVQDHETNAEARDAHIRSVLNHIWGGATPFLRNVSCFIP